MINSFFVLGQLEPQDKEAIKILKDNQDLFHSNGSWDFLIHFFVDIGWFLTNWLYKFVNFVEDVLDKIVTFGGLMNSQEVTNLSMKMMPIAFTLMAVIIAILGFSIMMGMKISLSKLAINVILASLFIVSLPGIFQQAFDLNQGLYKDIKSSEFTGKSDLNLNRNNNLKRLSSQIMANNITDLVWYANHHYKPASNDINNEFVDDSFTNGYRRWTEKIKPADKKENKEEGFRYYKSISTSDVNKAVFNNSIVQADSDDDNAYDGFVLKPLSEGIGKSFLSNTTEAFSGYYQRYQANFFAIWFELGVLTFVYVLTAFKIARLGYEVTAQKIVAPWVAATDIATLQKIKQLMINLFTNYGLIALIFILLKVFVILSNTTFKSDIPLSAKLIIFLVLAIGTIDGPDEIKKLLGVDAGIRDGYRTAMAGMAGMAVAGKAGGKVAHATSSGVKGIQNTFSSNKRAENARSSAKSVADEIHDKHMLDNAGSYNKRDNQKNKDEKSFINPDNPNLQQDKKQGENSYSDTGNDSKLNKSNNQTEEAEDNKNGHDKNIDSKEKDSLGNNDLPENVSVDIANEDNQYKYDNDNIDDSNHEDFHVDGDSNEISEDSKIMHNEDLEHPNDDFDSVSNGNGLDNDLIGNELEHENAKVSQLENKEDITENEPNDSLVEDKNSKYSDNKRFENISNEIDKEIKNDSHSKINSKGTRDYQYLINEDNQHLNNDMKSNVKDSDSFETIKSNGNAQKYRGSKAVNKSWLEYKINKSNQGGKQN